MWPGAMPDSASDVTLHNGTTTDQVVTVDTDAFAHQVAVTGVTHPLTLAVPADANLSVTQGLTIGDDGVLQLDGQLLTSALNIDAGGTVGGDGTVWGDVVNAGVVGPGGSPGVVSIEGNYTQTAAGELLIEMGGTRAGTVRRAGDHWIGCGGRAADRRSG